MNTKLLFQTIHFVNQLSICGAVSNWCHQFGLIGRVKFFVDNEMLTKSQRDEVQLLVFPPTIPSGKRIRENALCFEVLTRIKTAHISARISLLPTSCYNREKKYKIRSNGDDGWGTITPLFRESTLSKSFPKSHVWTLFPNAQSLDQLGKFKLWKFLMDME